MSRKQNINVTLNEIILGLPNRTGIINYRIIPGKLCNLECETLESMGVDKTWAMAHGLAHGPPYGLPIFLIGK